MSVSAPFLTLSVQLAAAQIPPLQTALVQSPALAHFFPSAHAGQLPPPQSMSVSAPFLTLSVQLGSAASGCAMSAMGASLPGEPSSAASAGAASGVLLAS